MNLESTIIFKDKIIPPSPHHFWSLFGSPPFLPKVTSFMDSPLLMLTSSPDSPKAFKVQRTKTACRFVGCRTHKSVSFYGHTEVSQWCARTEFCPLSQDTGKCLTFFHPLFMSVLGQKEWLSLKFWKFFLTDKKFRKIHMRHENFMTLCHD